MSEETAKQCRRCAEVKVLSEFSRKTVAKDGLQCYCRSCARVFTSIITKSTSKGSWRVTTPELKKFA